MASRSRNPFWCGRTKSFGDNRTTSRQRSQREGFMIRAILAAVLLSASAAMAQGYPVKPLRLIVPLVPGGNQDIMACEVPEKKWAMNTALSPVSFSVP